MLEFCFVCIVLGLVRSAVVVCDGGICILIAWMELSFCLNTIIMSHLKNNMQKRTKFKAMQPARPRPIDGWTMVVFGLYSMVSYIYKWTHSMLWALQAFMGPHTRPDAFTLTFFTFFCCCQCRSFGFCYSQSSNDFFWSRHLLTICSYFSCCVDRKYF